MPITNPGLESIGTSLIIGTSIKEQPLPNNKIADGRNKDERRLHRIKAKELREFNQPMVDASEHTKIDLRQALRDRDEQILESLKNYKNITPEEAMHIPYAYYKAA